MSAYNGSKYIREQIDSILSQTYQDFKLYIRIDGSNDGTDQIINEYIKKYPEVIEIIDKDGPNLGCGQSFMTLLKNVEADYYMYSDQDDVWLPRKIEQSLLKIREIDETGYDSYPCVAFTDAIVVDSQLNTIYDSLWKSNNRNPEFTKNIYYYEVYRQAALGCTMIFNNAARNISLKANSYPDREGHHDRLVIFICSKYGKITYLNEALIKYRQHSANVTSFTGKIYSKNKVLRSFTHPLKLFRILNIRFRKLKKLPFRVSLARLYLTMLKKWMFQGYMTKL